MPKKFKSNTQGSEIDFQLHTLGWKSFQDLCSTILKSIFGQTYQIFSSTKDAGKDGAFYGVWNQNMGEILIGSFVVQCKFTNKYKGSLSLTDLKEERKKAELLAKKKLCDNYIILTNFSLTGSADTKIRDYFLEISGINQVKIYGKEWITGTIRESSSLRMLVPRIYGLGDLSQIIDERAYHQALEILASMSDDLSKFVITDAYKRSVNAIADSGVVMLIGEPASGKTTIAAALSLGSIDRWECLPIKIRNSDQFRKHWNVNEPKQLFWVDDIFGATQYQRQYVDEWNQEFPAVNAAIRKGARFIFTSRNYIFNAAIKDLKLNTLNLPDKSKIIINVHQITKQEKEQILYNHIKMGDQTKKFKGSIKKFLPLIIKNQDFLPETARRLGNRSFTENLSLTKYSIQKFVEHPIEFLLETIRTIDKDSRAALAYVYGRGEKKFSVRIFKTRP